MYSDRLTKRKTWILWVLLLALLLGGFAAVQRSALQCYAVEGAYPPDLQYLEDNYGLQVNKKDFYVTYEAFASNLPPTVRVTVR